MKTFTNSLRNIFKVSALVALIFGFMSANAQGFQNGSVYVHDNGEMHIAANDFKFGTAAGVKTETSRTASTYGKISFSATATWSDASNAHHVDGYVRTYKNASQFIFPIGDGGVYGPAAAIPTAATGVDAAYIRANPSAVGTALDAALDGVSTVEYWDIKSSGANAKISLTWSSSSNVSSAITNNIGDLTIAAWDGSKWVKIASTVDATSILGGSSTLTTGSITSDANVTLASYTAFTLASKDEACTPLVAWDGGATITFNGTAWSATPTAASKVQITGNGEPGSFVCNSLDVNGKIITIKNGQLVDVVGDVTGTSSSTGKIVMEGKASLVQRSSSATAPYIELTKVSDPVHRFDVEYWSSPIASGVFSPETIIYGSGTTVVASVNARIQGQTTKGLGALLYFDPALYNTANTPAGDGSSDLFTTNTHWFAVPSSSDVVVGKGFSARVKSQAPFSFADVTTTGIVEFPFFGTANNGDISVNTDFQVVNSGATYSRYNLLGNPYPSVVDADKFLYENRADLEGTLWFNTNNTVYSSGNTYQTSDYATYTPAGGGVAPGSETAPTGYIGSAQGFLVKRTGTTANTGVKPAKFTNCMRDLAAGQNTVFYRTANIKPAVDRYWVNLTPVEGVSKQILVGYVEGATADFDNMYDGSLNSVSGSKLYTFIGTGKYAINVKPSFVESDVVPFGLTKENTNNETFTLSLSGKQGVFANNVDVYVHDKVLNVYHNLTESNYTFTTSNQIENNRFEFVYQTSVLSNTDFQSTSVVMALENNMFAIRAKEAIDMVYIYDLTGRLVEKYSANNATELTESFYHQEGIYVAKAKLANGSVVSEKLINIK